jgi:hypothetical protein
MIRRANDLILSCPLGPRCLRATLTTPLRALSWFLLLALGCLGLAQVRGEETAQARLYCLSLSFQPGSDATTGEYSLRLDSGELWPYDSSYYAAYVTLYDNWFDEPVDRGYILLPVPDIGDANHNGFEDFFESAQPVNSASTSGSYSLSASGSGTLQATWSRAAGLSWGGCALKLKPTSFYTWLTFNGSFQLIEYAGPLTYTPGTMAVAGSVALTQTDVPDSFYGGPVTFIKTTPNRFNALVLQPGIWTNASQQTCTYTNSLFQRDTRWPTNYYGYLIFYYDYDPSAVYPFNVWMLSIDDTNDTNHNGIPDFSDDLSAPQPPRSPRLTLTRGSTNLWLTISGDIGHVHQVQELPSLASTNWTTIWSQSLTNDPQTVWLAIPPERGKFWRVLAQ